jgi:hypothetical protein
MALQFPSEEAEATVKCISVTPRTRAKPLLRRCGRNLRNSDGMLSEYPNRPAHGNFLLQCSQQRSDTGPDSLSSGELGLAIMDGMQQLRAMNRAMQGQLC